MSTRDLMASWLRSAARGAASQLTRAPLAGALRERLRGLSLGRTAVGDAELTRAVLRLPDVAAATVACGQGRVAVDIGFSRGDQLRVAIYPEKITFAPGGAKELRFVLEPAAAASDPRARDVVAVIAGEIARGLWRPALSGAPDAEHAAFVNVEGERVVVDLRNVPQVRWALQQGLRAAIIEAIQPRAIEPRAGHVDLPLAIHLR